ncbi:MAG: nickel ABC transporter, nickel/metallophore periplasmic binding protein [Lachnospiraceae bacterium]|jgi:nickel transport system substrate-binding protein|nr:nickel ABC transporter, nickel/metallophore periplasmic binding protein [Lachnospiraceae bacterium]
MKRRTWSILLIFAMLLSLAACGQKKTEEEAPQTTQEQDTENQESVKEPEGEKGDTLVVRAAKDIGDMNPHTMKSQMFAQDWVYESLVAMKNGEIVPELAENWEVSEDGKTYTFYLRENVKFSDGSDFNSEIAKKNIEAVMAHADGYSFLQSLDSISGIETPDEKTLVLTLNEPCNSLLNDFTFSRPLVILGEAGFPAEGDPYDNGVTEPIGTGMWVLKEYVADQYAVFERNENYWGEKPSFQYLRAVVIPDVNTAASALKAGEIDLMMDSTQITAELYEELGAAGFYTAKAPTTSISNLNINTGGEITGDLQVRLALEYATDKQAISDGIFNGLQEPATAYFAEEVPYTNTGVEPYPYDPEKAKEILEQSGWVYENGDTVRSKDGKKLEIDLIYDSSVTKDMDIGLILQSQYAEVGIQLNIVPQDSQVYRENWTNGDFGVLIYSSWGGSYEPYATLAAMAKDGDKFNTVQKGMSNKAELDQVMQDCLSQTDEEKLAENFTYIMQSFHDEAVYVPLTVTNKLGVMRSDLTGMDLATGQDSMDVGGITWAE